MTSVALYNQIVDIVSDYLGPAGDRFTQRLITFHLDKAPEEVAKSDIPELSSWLKAALGMLTNDKSMVDECEKKILKLAK